MQRDLYSPSLEDHETTVTKSYNIGGLFVVAFFGGIIGVSVLGIRNAMWLRLGRKYIQFLVAISVVLFVCKTLLIFGILNGLVPLDESYSNNIARGFGVLCFAFYYFTLKKPFNEHLALGGGTEVLYKQGFLWVIISAFIEGFLIMISGG